MPKRTITPFHAEKTKDLIRASQLLNRLNSFVNGECSLTTAQVAAARIVIGKAIPDLKTMEIVGDPLKPVALEVSERPLLNKAEWLKLHGLDNGN